jgi:hypothetical protein
LEPDALPTTCNGPSAIVIDEEKAMEDFIREIFVASPALPSAPLPSDSSPVLPNGEGLAGSTLNVDWDSEAEMRRLLNMLPNVQSTDGGDYSAKEEPVDFSALDFDMSGEWGLDNLTPSSLGIGVF